MHRLRHQLFAGWPVSPPISTFKSEAATISISFFSCSMLPRQADDLLALRQRVIHRLRRQGRFALPRRAISSALFSAPATSAAISRSSSSLKLSKRSASMPSEGQRANQRLPGKQRQSHAGMDFEALMTGDQPVIGVGQVAIRREAHHIPGAQSPPAAGVLPGQSADRAHPAPGHRSPAAQTDAPHSAARRGIAAKNLPQGSNQARKAVGVDQYRFVNLWRFSPSSSTEKLIVAPLSF